MINEATFVVKETPSSGRGLYATRKIAKNEFILSSKVAASALHRKHLSSMCQHCFRYSEDDDQEFQIKCPNCATFYCSTVCQEQDMPLHSPHCSWLSQISSTKTLKKEESCHVRLLFRMLSRCCCSSDATVLPSIEFMMPDNKNIPGFKRRNIQREKAAKFFVDMLPNDPTTTTSATTNNNTSTTETSSYGAAMKEEKESKHLSLVEQLRLAPTFRSKSAVANYLSRGPANEFALFDQNGEGCGCGFFPLAALVNHSCMPSASVQLEKNNMMFYATRNIAVGEQITQSYTNLTGDGRMSRVENLQESWGFTCQCVRCIATTKEDEQILIKFDKEHVCACGGVSVPASNRGSREGNCQCNAANLFFSFSSEASDYSNDNSKFEREKK